MSGFDANTTVDEQVLAAFLTPICSREAGRDVEVQVYTFRDRDGGLRVSEVSTIIRGDSARGDKFISAGGSWMRSDAECGGIILAFEDYLLWRSEPIQVRHGICGGKYDPHIYDPALEVEHAVVYAVTGTTPDWEYRWPADLTVDDGTVWYDHEKQEAYNKAHGLVSEDA